MWRHQKSVSCIYIDVCVRVVHSSSSRSDFKQRNHSQVVRDAHWRELFEKYAKQNSLSEKDWYQLSSSSLDEKLQHIVSKKFRGSMYRALSTIFPELEWKAWKFQHHRVPKNFWREQSNQRKFFDDLGHILGVKSLDDWYGMLFAEMISKHGGSGLLDRYNNSPMNALISAYPEHNWTLWKFSHISKWNDQSNQRHFFDELGKQIGVRVLDDWYQKSSFKEIVKHGGSRILAHYNNSPAAALMAIYPEHNWIPWKFSMIPSGYWNSKDNVTKFLNDLSEKLSIHTLDDWYLVDQKLLKQLGAAALIIKYKGLHNMLQHLYPHHPWDRRKFIQAGKTQRWLAVNIKKLFPNEGDFFYLCLAHKPEILENYIHPKAVFSTSNRPIQLDIYIPSKLLAFEYQGEQHYQDCEIFSPTRIYKQRDEEKRTVCAANNIKLIEIPYWWNRTLEGLEEMINKCLHNNSLDTNCNK